MRVRHLLILVELHPAHGLDPLTRLLLSLRKSLLAALLPLAAEMRAVHDLGIGRIGPELPLLALAQRIAARISPFFTEHFSKYCRELFRFIYVIII